jgi:hypothetical protein
VKGAIGAPEMLWRLLIRHARPRAGHPRLVFAVKQKTWMAGTSPAMTGVVNLSSVCESLQCAIDCWPKSPRRRFAAKKFRDKNFSISDACAAVANQCVDRA